MNRASRHDYGKVEKIAHVQGKAVRSGKRVVGRTTGALSRARRMTAHSKAETLRKCRTAKTGDETPLPAIGTTPVENRNRRLGHRNIVELADTRLEKGRKPVTPHPETTLGATLLPAGDHFLRLIPLGSHSGRVVHALEEVGTYVFIHVNVAKIVLDVQDPLLRRWPEITVFPDRGMT